MEYKIMIPSTVWQDYDPEAEPLELVKEEGAVSKEVYRFTALTKDEEKVRVAVKVLLPSSDIKGAVLVVHQYHALPDDWVLNDLVSGGYMVVLPDLTGISNPATNYPPSLEYGYIEKAGDHIKKVMPTPKETCQYLYTIIIRRTLVFLKEKFAPEGIVLLGMGDAVEVAMQAAGIAGGIKGLACINGSGYREYIKLNKYGGGNELVMDEERMSWLSGVSSVAYAKFINVPTFVAVGTNSTVSDIDRLSNLKALMPTESFHTVYSPSASDYIMPEAYSSFKIWLNAVFRDTPLPDCPDIDLRANDDGSLYVDVHCDPKAVIESVDVYYSEGEYDHKIRYWQRMQGLSIASGEYIATPQVREEDVPFFAYAEIKYATGLTLCSLIEFAELGELSIKAKQEKASRIIYETSMDLNGFVDGYNGDVLPRTGLELVELTGGTKGIISRYGSLKTYLRNPGQGIDNDVLLHIDMYSDEYKEVSVSIEKHNEEGSKCYKTTVKLQPTKGFFTGVKFKTGDFKDERMMPLTDWDICSIKIAANHIIIGNILFV
ncbi:MAG: hypothetical protein PHI19_06745 [Clostridia bacterium]|nr:hypothetical protein [Clostridia bacterium]